MEKRIKLANVSSTRGAPMGRNDDHIVGKCRLQKVVMYDGCYDKGGAYWGMGTQLWVCEDSDGSQMFVRASTRIEAKKLIVEDMLSHDVTFYR